MIEVSGLNVFPVKSFQGINLKIAELSRRGLKYDRQWMVTDANYKFVTQRQIPLMASIKVSIKENFLILEHTSISPLYITIGKKSRSFLKASIWGDNCFAYDEGDEVSKWLSEVLGKEKYKNLRLVRFADEYHRTVNKKYLKGEESHTTFSDGFPFLITAEESLDLLNQKLVDQKSHPVGMERFRSNIILKGINAFEENKLDSIIEMNKKYSFGIRKPCERCVITTIDQETSRIIEPKEPLRTLVKINPYPAVRGAFFGQNSTLLTGENKTISVGDKLKGIYI